ncbi:DUF1963 domain-containing protein [Zavarzinia compransoris]|uniref:DUF1963 domain-containing protein n=1 Tax=Zavarzinia compransoris TaxID=1264899 RepID=A0A317E4F6_9PROT|nr:DUF1963 domain-containing protein [Zavarzinia compransoris]PWR21927.1 hypothetical protein DKG75_08065 [Zavarzinia compransoris]TDP47339.1 uncharacterized protein DUF1963 [Zavarzinia compransoris]
MPDARQTAAAAAGARYRASGTAADAYALGAIDLAEAEALGSAPAGLCFLLPLAAKYAGLRQGRAATQAIQPHATLNPVEKAAVDAVHLCLSGTRGDLDRLMESVLFHPLYMAMNDLHRLNLRHWGLDGSDPATPSFTRLLHAPPPTPLKREDLGKTDQSPLIQTLATIAWAIGDSGAGPFAEQNLIPEIRFADSLPALFVEKAPRPWGPPPGNPSESWFGGRPRLGGADWPRHSQSGEPLFFVTQISLRAVADAGAGALPQGGGWLAFFIGYNGKGPPQGAVVPVAGDRLPAETAVPDDAPPARQYFTNEEQILPDSDPRLFPRWPIRLVPAAVSLKDIKQGFHAAVEKRDGRRPARFDADAVYAAAGLGTPDVWWYCVHDFAHHLAGLSLNDLTAEETAAILDYGAAVRQMAAGKPLWQALTPDETARFRELCDRQRPLKHRGRALFPEELTSRALRALLVAGTGAGAQAAALPPAVRAVVEARYLRPAGTWRQWHQMFGPPATIQGEIDLDHRGDILLLHLAEDRVMNLELGGQWQFWISPADLKAGRWQAATLTMESS